MLAMVLHRQREPLRLKDRPKPKPGPGQVLVKVSCCGVCRTDLHVVDGDLTEPKLPLVPGHQIVGKVSMIGAGGGPFLLGQKIGIPWLGGSCGHCEYCARGEENLCDNARYTGYQLDGGFAEYCVADMRFCFPLPAGYPDLQAAPLLCAGLIGYRSYRMAVGSSTEMADGTSALPPVARASRPRNDRMADGTSALPPVARASRPQNDGMADGTSALPDLGATRRLGLYGFGAAAHIIIQVARFHGREVYAFTRPGDTSAQEFARGLGAVWAGGSDESPPQPLDAAVIFAPAGALVPAALRSVRKGGTVVCAGIHMSDIPSFPYSILWGERVVRSVANLTRQDGEEFLALAPQVPVKTEVHPYPLEKANQALDDLRNGRFNGQAVLVVERPAVEGQDWPALKVLEPDDIVA